jgi:hypothetical protein
MPAVNQSLRRRGLARLAPYLIAVIALPGAALAALDSGPPAPGAPQLRVNLAIGANASATSAAADRPAPTPWTAAPPRHGATQWTGSVTIDLGPNAQSAAPASRWELTSPSAISWR